MNTDSSGNVYEEVAILGGDIRMSFIARGWANAPSIRIQIKDEKGHLRQGPEIPVSELGAVIGGMVELATIRSK